MTGKSIQLENSSLPRRDNDDDDDDTMATAIIIIIMMRRQYSLCEHTHYLLKVNLASLFLSSPALVGGWWLVPAEKFGKGSQMNGTLNYTEVAAAIDVII